MKVGLQIQDCVYLLVSLAVSLGKEQQRYISLVYLYWMKLNQTLYLAANFLTLKKQCPLHVHCNLWNNVEVSS